VASPDAGPEALDALAEGEVEAMREVAEAAGPSEAFRVASADLPGAGAVPAEPRAPEREQRAERVGGAPPWAFLLEEEADVDPDELFRGAGTFGGPERPAGAVAHEELLAGAARVEDSAPGRVGASAGEAPDVGRPLLEEDDLKKFREWLKSLK
jgi:hypothetical protein